jgi:hypothetical protein
MQGARDDDVVHDYSPAAWGCGLDTPLIVLANARTFITPIEAPRQPEQLRDTLDWIG